MGHISSQIAKFFMGIFLSLIFFSLQETYSAEVFSFGVKTKNYPIVSIETLLTENHKYQDLSNFPFEIIENNQKINEFNVEELLNKFYSNNLLIIFNGSSLFRGKFDKFIKPSIITLIENNSFGDLSIALATFNENLFLINDFTENYNEIKNNLNNPIFSGKADLNSLFNENQFNLRKIIGNKLCNIILITDGTESGEISYIKSEKSKISANFHSIIINSRPSKLVSEFIDDGMSFYSNNEFHLLNKLGAFVKNFQYEKISNIVYKSTTCSDFKEVLLDFTSLSLKDSSTYEINFTALPSLIVEKDFHYYGLIQPPFNSTQLFRLSAKNDDIVISNVSNSSRFKIIEPDLPIQINEGETVNIRVQYNPLDTNYVYEEIVFEGSFCDEKKLRLSGGSLRNNSIPKTLRIISPNGGEQLVVGTNYLIEWDGVLPTDTVSIDFSTDNGNNWTNITNNASGLKYLWTSIPFTPNSNCLLRIKHLSLFDLSKNIISLKGIQGRILNLIWRHNNNEIYTASTDGFIRLWNTQNGEPVKTISGNIPDLLNFDFNIDFSRYAIIVNNSNKIIIKNPDNEFEEFEISIGNNNLELLDWNPVNNLIALASNEGNLYIYDNLTREIISEIKEESPITNILWNKIGDELIISLSNGWVKIYNHGLNLVKSFKVSDQKVTSLDFNPTSKFIVTSSMNEYINIWDINSLSNITSFNNFLKPVNVVSWDPGAKHITSSSADSSITLWQPGTGSKYYVFRGHNNLVNKIAWRADGSKVASSTIQGEVFVWSPEDIPFNKPTLQEDLSDNIWSIINPNVTLKSVVFGNVMIGSIKDSLINQIFANNTNTAISIDTIYIRGASKSFFILDNSLRFPYEVDAQDWLNLTIRFSPTTFSNKLDTLVFVTGMREFRCQLIGFTSNRLLQVSPPYYDFGIVKIGSENSVKEITLTNLSTESLFVENIVNLNKSDNNFEIIGFQPTFIDPLQEFKFNIKFKPDKYDLTSAMFDILYDGKQDYDLIQLIGRGAGPQIQVDEIIDFGAFTCETGGKNDIIIYNIGNDDLLINNVIFAAEQDKFSLDLSNTSMRLVPGDSTTIKLIFESVEKGNFTSELIIKTNVNTDKSSEKIIKLNASKREFNYELSKNSIIFNLFEVNKSEEKRFWIVNKGDAKLFWEFPVNYEYFTIESIYPQTTLPGDSSEVLVIFKGADSFGTYNLEHIFEDTCGINKKLNIVAYVGPNLSQIDFSNMNDFPVVYCDEISKSSLFIKNTGKTNLILSDVQIQSNIGSFVLDDLSQNIIIIPDDSVEIKIQFDPQNFGNNYDTLIISSNALNSIDGVTKYPLAAFFANSAFSVKPEIFESSNLFQHEKLKFSVNIQNTGNSILQWSELPHSNLVVIDSIVPAIIQPGEISKCYITFNGGEFNQIYFEQLIFENSCNSSDTVNVKFVIDGTASVGLKIPHIISKPGEIINLPIYLINYGDKPLPDATGYITTISFNSTTLVPIDNIDTYVKNGKRYIQLELNPAPFTDSTLTSLKMLVTLGNEDSTSIELSNSKILGISENTRIMEINGMIVLDSKSTENGLRLVGNSGRLRLQQNTPNPVVDKSQIKFSSIENGFHEIIIYNLAGNVAKTVFSGFIKAGDYEVDFDTSFLSSGNYIYQLKTPSTTVSKKLTILK